MSTPMCYDPATAALADWYNQHFEMYPNDITREAQGWATLLELLPPNARVLDCGAGQGKYALELANNGHVVSAWDISSVAVAQMLNDAGGLPNFSAECRDVRAGIEHPYDAILALAMIQHLEPAQMLAFVADMKAHTKPGGFNFILLIANLLHETPLPLGYMPSDDVEIVDLYVDSDWDIVFDYAERELGGSIHCLIFQKPMR